MKPGALWSATRPWACAAAVGLLTLFPAQAMYKVVQPDGSVTYTDRPPATGNARVTPLGRDASSVAATGGANQGALPLALRQAMQRYPVTLYTSADCAPCAAGRQLLQARGVPFRERLVLTVDDAAALERLVGGRTVPALTVGNQPLRGLSQTDWTAYLDAAGYPRESQLPRNWPQQPATPLVERATPNVQAQAPAAAPAPPPATPDEATPEPAAEAPIRF
jgi:glutaredoxin